MLFSIMRNFTKSALLVALIVAFVCCAFPSQAHAGYLDPGSGSTLVQGIIAGIAAMKRFWRKLMGIFTGKKD